MSLACPGRPQLWVFCFAADMGGMGYIAANESALLLSNTAITTNVVRSCVAHGAARLFMASSACVYPVGLQSARGTAPALREEDAWPAQPQDGYGLEKLYAEELAIRAAAGAAHGGGAAAHAQPLAVRVARFHNVYGPRGTWVGGREKAPAAFLRKALLLAELDAVAPGHGEGLEVWGDGSQTRTFCYVTDAVAGVLALMCSDAPAAASPVNIGSDEAVTVGELALLAGEAAGVPRDALARRVRLHPGGPIGVQSRSADLGKAAVALGWAPVVPLAVGLRRTAAWLRDEELPRLRAAAAAVTAPGASPTPWEAFLRAGLTSPHATQAEPWRFALLVPVTSRTSGRAGVERGLRAFLRSVADTTGCEEPPASPGSGAPPPQRDDGAAAWQFDIIFGVDAGDTVCDPAAPGSLDLPGLVRQELPLGAALGRVTARVATFRLPPGSVCRIWSDLAAGAFTAGAHFAVLLGDDIVLRSRGWADAILRCFRRLAADTGLPFGFACVAFVDDAFPGFPTFPVLHRAHADVFGGRVIPASFANQDADPFLFQLYRAFGAAAMEPAARLANTVGGAGDARYAKWHVPWTGALLSTARDEAQHWLELRRGLGVALPPRRQPPGSGGGRVITLDVVVPTFRVPAGVLEAILALDVPPGASTQFTVICDRPGDARAGAVMAALEARHRENPFVRLRTNAANLGASASRNRGFAESAADWVLFLDDDVVPQPDILHAYASAIRAHPRATGFVGLSRLPPPATARQAAVHMAGVAFFWGVAAASPAATELPWGVTANLCVRRPPPGSGVEFSDAFPKTGGGEDIDFCLRLREHVRATMEGGGEGLVATPGAVITHPWWDDGVPALSHFSGWSWGDGHLIDLYPQLTYTNLPDLSETLLALGVGAAAQLTARGVLRLAAVRGGSGGGGITLPLGVERLLQRASSSSALAATAAAAGACVAADLLVDSWIQLVAAPNPACAHLPLHTRAAAVATAVLVRTVSEVGRMAGHASRGRLAANLGRRFNWFGHWWDGAPAEERWQAARRTAVRAAAAAVAVALVLRGGGSRRA
jgi:nucleoside-diphosphate-sugar epimerase